jgi:hypothetical protein
LSWTVERAAAQTTAQTSPDLARAHRIVVKPQ